MIKTPARIIYEAWEETPKPLIYETADAKGNPVRKEVEFAGPGESRFYDAAYHGPCNLCGCETWGGIPAKKLFSSNYMDWPLHAAPDSSHVCEACAFCILMNPVGRIALFRYPLVAERTLHLCNRAQMRDWLITPPDPPFVMIMPVSQKKHLFSKARVSYDRDRFWCNLEERVIPVDAGFVKIVEAIEALRALGINKTQIATEIIPAPFLKAYGVSGAEWALALIDEIKKDPSFPLAMEVAQKMTEEDAACYMDFRRTTR